MTLENFNYRTDPMFLRDQFPSDNIYGIPSLPKAALTGEEQEKLMLIALTVLNLITQIIQNASFTSLYMIITDVDVPRLYRRRVPCVRRWWVKIPHRRPQELKLHDVC